MSGIRINVIGIAGVLLGLLGLAHTALADDEWEHLSQLPRGERIRVVPRHGRSVVGELAAVRPEGLRLVRNRGGEIDLPRTDISLVYKKLHSRAKTAAPWIGAASGFGLGFAIGWHGIVWTPPNQPASGATFGAIGAACGAVLGRFMPGRSERLVYVAP